MRVNVMVELKTAACCLSTRPSSATQSLPRSLTASKALARIVAINHQPGIKDLIVPGHHLAAFDLRNLDFHRCAGRSEKTDGRNGPRLPFAQVGQLRLRRQRIAKNRVLRQIHLLFEKSLESMETCSFDPSTTP